MLASRALLRRLLTAAAVVALAVPALPAPVTAGSPTPAPKPPVVIAPPNVTASGPNVYQAAPNAPIYYRPMAGRAPYDPIRTIGNLHNNEYHSPMDAVVVGAYLYVLDTGNGRFLKRRASDLAYVGQSASLGAHTAFAYRIATDGTYLYVTDIGSPSIVVFRVSTMAYVGKYGSTGTGTGQFEAPTGIAISGGRIYVADESSSRIVKLTTWPIHWVKTYGSTGTGTGHFANPSGVAVIGSYVYVADQANNRVVRFSTALTNAGWLAKTSYGSPATPFGVPAELATDGTYLYVHDSLNFALVKFTSSLGFVRKRASSGGPTSWNSQMGMAATTASLYLVHAGGYPGYSDQVTKDSLTTLAVTKVSGSNVATPDKWQSATAVAADAANTYVGDRTRIVVCPRTGTGCTRQIAVSGSSYITGIASDGTYLYVTDASASNVRKIVIATGVEVLSYGTYGTGNDQLEDPSGIAWSPIAGGVLFVLDKGNSRVVARIASDLSYGFQGGTAGNGDTQLSQPQGIATDGFYVYIADTGNTRIVKWTYSLSQAVATPATAGTGDGQFQNPQGIATDGDSVWVTDPQNANVQRLSALDLTFLSKTTGAGGMAFTSGGPYRAAAIDGRLLILDRSRAHVYEMWGGGPLKLSGSPSDSTSPLEYLFGWSGSAPAGWSSPDASLLALGGTDRYFGWTPAAVGGAVGVRLSTLANTSDPTVVNFVPDSTAPTVTQAPRPSFNIAFGASATILSGAVDWIATDPDSGLGKAELARSINGGAFTTVKTIVLAGAPTDFGMYYATTFKTGTTYRFRVRMTDTVGNVSAWSYGASFIPALVQENGTGVKASSGWTRTSIAGSLGGWVRTTTAAGKTLTFTGTMSQFNVVGRVMAGGGSFKVYVDGALLATAPTSGATTKNRQLIQLVLFPSKKVHTIKLVSVGDGPIYIDAFAIVR